MLNDAATVTTEATEDETHSAYLPRMTATYSPEDNKLRLYSVTRLDAETYQRVKCAGFKWAPKQELFVAPMWTPERAALLVELCGEIGDEDTSLVERAEERADRFEDYSANRAADAKAAHAAVSAIADNIPFGQPILVGHHSEKRARKDAERIRNGMRRAVDMWETSKYWEARAKGAIHAAKYKELPAVRHRRIKGLESDKRKQLKEIEESEAFSRLWTKAATMTHEHALSVANHDRGLPYGMWSRLDKHEITGADAAAEAIATHAKRIERARAWLAHIENRIAYERAMLGESGGTAADKFPIEIGGRVMSRHWRSRGKGWIVVTKINRDATGAIGSVSTAQGVIPVETITDYAAPEAGTVEAVKAAKKLPPIVNYPGEGFMHMTQAEWKLRAKHSDSYHVRPVKASEKHGAHRCREGWLPGGSFKSAGIYLTDAKRVDPPAPDAAPMVAPEVRAALKAIPVAEPARERTHTPEAPEAAPFDAMKRALRDGVAVVAVSAPELFPTPPALARIMVDRARIEPGMAVLEPSAGTGNILREIVATGANALAVEINPTLAASLRATYPDAEVCALDFMELDDLDGLRCFHAVVMNPPFSVEIEHVRRAFDLLRIGGVVVSVMSAGIKFRTDNKHAAFREFIEAHGTIEDLPDDTFKESGTGVRTVLVTLARTV